MTDTYGPHAVAVVGMAGRFPAAPNLAAFWRNLVDGVDSVSFFSRDELAAAGARPETYDDQDYVPARAALADIDLFDAAFFDIPAAEAEALDPQHRLFLECAWEALEDACHDPRAQTARVGVYASQSFNSYLLRRLIASRALVESFSLDQLPMMASINDDYLVSRVAYKLNLHGPAVRVQSACSSGLVAIHTAVQALLYGECDLALAGAVAVQVPQQMGYLYREGGVMSSDGRCRAFDRAANGTVSGSGLGVVVLKRLADALDDGDPVRAVIRATATNNDGAAKAGFAAPSVAGQAAVISDALALAGITPDTIGYVEAHGTGTPVGDPIEVAALTQSWRQYTDRTGFCALGSVKTNIGHLDAAAGVAGFIKAVLALEHGQIPPSLHFSRPNPELRIEDSPFHVNDRLSGWPAGNVPRRAAVSSFGVGGTNAHAILEQAPAREPTGTARPWQLLLLSARTPQALDSATTNLAGYLDATPQVGLADVAHTLRTGRTPFRWRRAVVCTDRATALAGLRGASPQAAQHSADTPPQVCFLFPGHGGQHVGMAAGLYRTEPRVREIIDHCAGLLRESLGCDLREVLFPDEAAERLARTELTQPALFTVEYAVAQLLMDWGIRPVAMLGHSLGEYVAACLAGVLSLPDALTLVAERGRLVAAAPPGAMATVRADPDRARDLAGADLDLAAVNGPSSCVLAGSPQAVRALERRAADQGVGVRRLPIGYAFHSALMDPVLTDFAAQVGKVPLAPPQVPYLSNLTGTWTTAEQATDPQHWVRHLRGCVQFSAGLAELLAVPGRILLEVGPGRMMTSLAQQHPGRAGAAAVLAALRHPADPRADEEVALTALGELWRHGVPVDLAGLDADERRYRVALPSYPFQRRRYWAGVDAPAADPPSVESTVESSGEPSGPVTLHQRPQLSTEFVAARDEIEQTIVDIWQHLLGYEQLGVFDNFFALGGDSLLSVRLFNLVQPAVGVDVPIERLYRAHTVAEQADVVRELLAAAGTAR